MEISKGGVLKDIIIDFAGTARLADFLGDPSQVHLLTVRSAGGLPQTLYFRFFASGGEILAIGEYNNLECETLRKGLVIANNELGNLGRELQRRNAEQKRAEERIQDALEYAENIVETVREPLVVLNAELEILTANNSFYHTFKVTPEETIGNFIYDLGNRQWDIPKLRVLLEEIIPHDTVFNGYEVEHDFLDIGRKTILLNARQIFRQNIGSHIILLAMEDITERKHAEDIIGSLLAEKELLLKEVHHRIKNNMNVINSLLSLQAATLKDPAAIAALEDSASRVQSMMVLYDKLYQSVGFSSLSVLHYLPSLVDDIVANFPNSKLVRIQKTIDDFVLDVRRLQPLGIIINELLTNIMKYAFTGRNDGCITVQATLTGKSVSLVVQDNGNGMPETVDFKNSTGLGLKVVRLLTKQIGGVIRIERGNGTRIILEFDI